jgi:hypothetical protein
MDDITLVSSTDSPEEVQAALTGKTVEAVKAENEAAAAAAKAAEPPPVPAAKPAADAKAETPAEPAAPANETPEQKAERERTAPWQKRLNKIQTQIDEFTEKKHQTRREAEQEELRLANLRREAAELEAKLAAGKSATPAPAAAADKTPTLSDAPSVPAPKLEDLNADGSPKFKNYEAWMDAHSEWTIAEAARRSEAVAKRAAEEARNADRARIERATADRETQNALAHYGTRLEEFKTTHADFDAVVDAAQPIAQGIVEDLGPDAFAIIDRYTTVDADNGPGIVYYLAQHPAEMERIAKLSPPLQLAALGKIDARLEAASTPARPPVAAPVTKAPEPIKPVGSSPTTSGVAPDDEDYQAYKARRNAEERAARGLPVHA